jgi:hypothetical protein
MKFAVGIDDSLGMKCNQPLHFMFASCNPYRLPWVRRPRFRPTRIVRVHATNRQGAAMSSRNLEHSITRVEFAVRRAVVIEEVVRDLEALVRDFSAKGLTSVGAAPAAERAACVGNEKTQANWIA